jgi:pimeloyl-ACP methyl ester carboxylesterase
VCVTLAPIRDHLPAASIAATALSALTTTATSTAIGYLPSLRSYDRYRILPAIRARTVIVSGGVDPLTPPQHAHELAAAIPNAVHLHVPNAGHMLPQQAPNVVNHAIEHATGLAPKPKNASASRISRSTIRPNPPGPAPRQPPVGARLPGVG